MSCRIRLFCALGALPLWACTAPDDTGAVDSGDTGADTADSGSPHDSDDPGDTSVDDTGTVDDNETTDTSACTDGVDETLALHDVSGTLTGAWSCSTGVSNDAPRLRFEDTVTGRLVAASEGAVNYRVALPSGTYRVLYDACGLIEQDQAGGTFLVDPALVVTGDVQRDLVLQGSDRQGLAAAGSAWLDSGWRWTMLHFYPVSGSQIPQRAIDRVADGDDFFDSYEVPVWDGLFEAFLPSGSYWVAFDTLAMGPIPVSTGEVDLDFPSVDTVVRLVANGHETNGTVFFRPQGAPADLIMAMWTDGRSHRLVPGTYDVWVTESQDVWDGTTIVPALLGIAPLPGGLVVDQSGTATIALTLAEVALDVQCGGEPLNGDIAFRPDGVPTGVQQFNHSGYLRLWGAPADVGVLAGSSGLFLIEDVGGCGFPAIRGTMPSASGPLALDVDLLAVTLDVRVDGAAAAQNTVELWSLETGRYTTLTGGVRPGDYLVVVRRSDGARVEKRVTLSASGTIRVDLTTATVPVSVVPTGGDLPAWLAFDTRFVPLADGGPVPPEYRTSVADADATSIRLAPGAYEVSFTPDRDGWYYDLPLVADGYCVEVGPG